jgi:hypothetical protein
MHCINIQSQREIADIYTTEYIDTQILTTSATIHQKLNLADYLVDVEAS